ncbi:aminotransferase class I/II-fold pyridoxal phosphate-dependent enzyme [Dyadobacter sandarakinus]|uniref:Pyridoxal phosphate-dependent aminotransferase family protein n=1 Tax=Dyadobacter sandarakinus TaxID=2747268 RepID=A0ABX7I9F1_9BACT|nr:aminotransferase class I/II-fold pyridoxal phosphate-dependent enzyme [Dyadobacter sandarakinus]QRR02741.1 pyridoxal phosphate-dependent aminotransferase family protein [Dyadobacter sandarakinus]
MITSRTFSLPGRNLITDDGQQFLWFSGTDYLGAGHNEALRRFILKGIEQYGTHYGSSRNSSLQLGVYQEAEERLAGFMGVSGTLLVSSGMWAGQLVMKEIKHLARLNNHSAELRYYYAPGAHPAIQGEDYTPVLISWRDWAAQSILQINDAEDDNTMHIVCTDAIGSPFVQTFDFSVFSQIKDPSRVILIIDESHSLGVLGAGGKGIYRDIPEALQSNALIVSSLNKAMGIPAGVISGSRLMIQALRHSPFFAGASPAAPAFIFALEKMLSHDLYSTMHNQLLENVAYFHSIFSVAGLFTSASNYPVLCSTDSRLFGFLLSQGIMASCFPYPKPDDLPVTRIVITALHQKEDLSRLAEVCTLYLKN